MGIDDKGNKQAYGTYGGRTAGAIRLFKFNYGMNWSDSSAGDTNDSDYLTILNVYVNKRYSNSSTEVRKAIYNNYVNLLKASNTRLSDETGTYVPRYYKNFMSCIQKNAVLPEQYSKMGTRIKIDYSTNDYVRRLDFTTAIDAMISRNAQACLNHRFASYEELWNEYMALPWYFRMFIDAQSIYDQYQAGFVSTATWFISKDGSEQEWDIKRSNRFAEQIGGPWLGIHVDFFWGEEVLNAEELGNWAFGYWASACGFDRKTIVAGSALENFGDNLLKLKWVTSENPNDIKYYNEGIAQFIREHPELSR